MQLVQEQAARNMVNDLEHGAETQSSGRDREPYQTGWGSEEEELSRKRIRLVLKWYYGRHSKCQFIQTVCNSTHQPLPSHLYCF